MDFAVARPPKFDLLPGTAPRSTDETPIDWSRTRVARPPSRDPLRPLGHRGRDPLSHQPRPDPGRADAAVGDTEVNQPGLEATVDQSLAWPRGASDSGGW